jgi:hypothetical protein
MEFTRWARQLQAFSRHAPAPRNRAAVRVNAETVRWSSPSVSRSPSSPRIFLTSYCIPGRLAQKVHGRTLRPTQDRPLNLRVGRTQTVHERKSDDVALPAVQPRHGIGADAALPGCFPGFEGADLPAATLVKPSLHHDLRRASQPLAFNCLDCSFYLSKLLFRERS